MTTLHLLSRAKINWTLDITGQRPDGYHLMDMLMQCVTLSDDITLTRLETPELHLTTGGQPYLPPDEHHLALRAARALQAATGCTLGARIHVEKHIPVGAGMGGGSSDAAGVLLGLNRLWGLSLSTEALEAIGLTLGADVPFCIRGGLTRTTGIGESMVSLPCATMHPLLVIQPCEGLSTKEVFTAYHAHAITLRPDTQCAQEALVAGDLPRLCSALGNVLQPVSALLRPEIEQAIAALKDAGACTALMTGSGSAVFGVFGDDASADAAYDALKGRYDRIFRCATCMDSVAEIAT